MNAGGVLMKEEKIKDAVKKTYSEIVSRERQQCCSSPCCGDSTLSQAMAAGYLPEELGNVPEEAAMGLGCGNPTAIAALKEGEVVVDLGSGAGLDVFLASSKVGPKGKVIGVDMTEEMLEKARSLAQTHGYGNVEFRLGEIENLPLEDESADVIISNCVINLSPDKGRVFQEAYRVLRPKGRLAVSDIVSEEPLPAELRQDLEAWAACVGGALEQGEYLNMIGAAGFKEVKVSSSREFYVEVEPGKEMCRLRSITVEAYKPQK
jgi:SAM-dependent methyltransferase